MAPPASPESHQLSQPTNHESDRPLARATPSPTPYPSARKHTPLWAETPVSRAAGCVNPSLSPADGPGNEIIGSHVLMTRPNFIDILAKWMSASLDRLLSNLDNHVGLSYFVKIIEVYSLIKVKMIFSGRQCLSASASCRFPSIIRTFKSATRDHESSQLQELQASVNQLMSSAQSNGKQRSLYAVP